MNFELYALYFHVFWKILQVVCYIHLADIFVLNNRYSACTCYQFVWFCFLGILPMVKMFLVSFAEKTFNYLPKSESHLQSSFYLVLIRFNMSTHTIKIWIEEISSTFITNKLHNQKYYIIIDVKKNKKNLEFCYIESLCCIGSTLSFFFFFRLLLLFLFYFIYLLGNMSNY